LYLWPCNVRAWDCWCDVQTEWRSPGMGGTAWLDLAGVRAYLDEEGITGDERKDIWAGIRAAQAATLEAWAEKAKKANQQAQQQGR